MPRSPHPAIRCPHAKPEDTCFLPPGVRYCVCYGDQQKDYVGQVSIRSGQVFWCVEAGGKSRGWYSWVAVVQHGAQPVPLELQDVPALRETVEDGRAYYVVLGPRDQRFEIAASALVEAALEGRETLDAVPAPAH